MAIHDLPSPLPEAFQAFNDQDPDTLVADFHEEATFYDPAQDGELSRAEYRDYCADLFVAFPDGRWEVKQFVSSGGTTTVE